MIYLPGDPRTTQYIRKFILISGLIGRSTTMYVTAKHWGEIVAELDAQYLDALLDPDGPVPWRNSNHFVIGNEPQRLTIVNAGTESQIAVDKMNRDTPGAMDFIARRDKLRVA